ncbi:aldo/keto reductase family protein [Legionella fallonii]|uniref:D-xylose reductase III n=1 Tax=Legionella fallonii LLAP-10 TaxID=1212491 RepID=A0A098FZK1_9GAMM|nr:aldo/keto reductase [Legionella fallonii]CEG55662.1 D-xylose reductase III [Legionella fallonii LLAP-10]
MSLLEQTSTSMDYPEMLYGTAWKEEQTQELVIQALNSGFIGIDTANQRRHYFEEGVGLGVQQFLQSNSIKREHLFLQSKFTYATGQDDRKPYNDQDPLPTQVKQSFISSLQHLHTDYLDSYILHGPYYTQGLTTADWEVWNTMEQIYHEGKVKHLGVSNININQLAELYKEASVKPFFVQNRCYAITQWDQKVRNFCTEHNLVYQGFSLLTANQQYISRPEIQAIATKHGKTIPQIIFRFAKEIGILSLTGTTNLQHMKEDLSINNFQLTNEDRSQIELIRMR